MPSRADRWEWEVTSVPGSGPQIRGMRARVRSSPFAASLAVAIPVALAACRGSEGRPANDTGTPETPPSRPPGVAAPAWPAALGGVLLVAGEPPRGGVLLVPDSAAGPEVLSQVRGAPVTLFGPAGRVGDAEVTGVAIDEDDECITWPTVRLERAPGAADAPWAFGILRAGALGLAPRPLTALATMAGRDSARLAMDLARFASGLPDDSVAAFRGLPIVVRTAALAVLDSATELVVAEVVRRVAQEATPLEDRVAFIATRPRAGGPFVLAWQARVNGLEETIEATDPVAVLTWGADGVAILLQRESARGVRYELVWRDAGGWRRGWASPWAGC